MVKMRNFMRHEVQNIQNHRIRQNQVFFKAFPELEGKIIVHYAVGQQVLRKYLGLFSEEEIHGISNLRGIPKEINPDLHLSKTRKEWNRFYKANQQATKQQILDFAAYIDKKFGHLFNPSAQ